MLKSNNTVQSNDFKKAQVYAGHIHIRQDYKNIHYVGTPYHKDRGDIGNKKGITVLKIESGRTDFIENKFSPQYKKVSIYDVLDTTVGELKEQWKNNYIDFVIKGDDSASCNFELLKECLCSYYKGFNQIDEGTVVAINHENVDLSETKPPMETMNDYINQTVDNEETRDGVKKMLDKITDKYEISCGQ